MAVHRSFSIASRILGGSKVSEGMTRVAPLITEAKLTQTQPNMGDKGTERQRRSLSVNR